MKIDIKVILILALLGLTLLFGLYWFWNQDKSSKKEINRLKKEYKILEDQKKLINDEILVWKNKTDSLIKIDTKLKSEIAKQEILIKKAELEAQKSKANLDKMRKDLIETRRRIEEVRNNPPNRTGNDLLESLKNKTKK
jgi:hypothetical protein